MTTVFSQSGPIECIQNSSFSPLDWHVSATWPIFKTCSRREKGTTNCKNDWPSIFARYNKPSFTTKPARSRAANLKQPFRDLSLRWSCATSLQEAKLDLSSSLRRVVSVSPTSSVSWFNSDYTTGTLLSPSLVDVTIALKSSAFTAAAAVLQSVSLLLSLRVDTRVTFASLCDNDKRHQLSK